MIQYTIEQLQAYIESALNAPSYVPPSPDLCNSLAHDPEVQGALLALIARRLQLSPSALHADIQLCRDDLSYYIEQEQREGTASAMRAYPHVWWHLWSSEEIAETYEYTRLLLDATEDGSLMLPVFPRKRSVSKPFLITLLHLSRSFLNVALPPASLGVTRSGEDEGESLLTERRTATNEIITLSVQQQTDQHWCILVVVQPQPEGLLVLTLGVQVFRVRFVAGRAVVSDVPSALLTAPDGPDMLLEIERDEDALP